MENDKLEIISNLFEGKEIRSIWDAEKEEYYFSVLITRQFFEKRRIAKKHQLW